MTGKPESVAGILCDVVDLLRGVVALIDAYPGRDGSDDLLAARSLARLARERAGEAQELDERSRWPV